MQQVTIETVKNGEPIRINGSAKNPKTYLKSGYCRINKAYEVINYFDISDVKYLKKGRFVLIDFEF